jgi:hypothetical protein
MTEQHDTSSDPRWPEPPVAGDEASTLLGALERQRATFAWKAGGLDAAGLRATTAASAITLGGLLKHLARVEDDYSSVRLFGREARPPFDRTGWSDDWSTAADNAPEQLYELWRDGVVRARAGFAEVLAAGGLDQPIALRWPDGRTSSLRRLLADMIEEYARHVGHADLVRESIDGVVGEDPQDGKAPALWPPLESGSAAT